MNLSCIDNLMYIVAVFISLLFVSVCVGEEYYNGPNLNKEIRGGLSIGAFVWKKDREGRYWHASKIREVGDDRFFLSDGKWYGKSIIRPMVDGDLVEVERNDGNYYQAVATFFAPSIVYISYTELPSSRDPRKYDSLDITARKGMGLKWNDSTVYYEKIRTYDGISSDLKKMDASVAAIYEKAYEKKEMFSKNCGSPTQEYDGNEYGYLLYQVDVPCFTRILTTTEQAFLGGVSYVLLDKCQFTFDEKTSKSLFRFVESTTIISEIGGTQYASYDLKNTLASQTVTTVAFGVGERLAEKLGCSEGERNVLKGISDYLEKTSSKNTGGMTFVDGCVRRHPGRYTKENCQCVADLARSVIPDIHQREFSTEIMEDISKRNPFISIANLIQCTIVK